MIGKPSFPGRWLLFNLSVFFSPRGFFFEKVWYKKSALGEFIKGRVVGAKP